MEFYNRLQKYIELVILANYNVFRPKIKIFRKKSYIVSLYYQKYMGL